MARDMTARTGHLGQENQDRKAMAEQSGYDNRRKGRWIGTTKTVQPWYGRKAGTGTGQLGQIGLDRNIRT
jgi:hypothetical protein